MQAQAQWLTRREIVALTGRSYDSVRRDQDRGVYANTRVRSGTTTVETLLDDVIAAGHYTPGAPEPTPEPAPQASGDEVLERLRDELVRARLRMEALEQQLLDVRDERTFLRRLLAQKVRD